MLCRYVFFIIGFIELAALVAYAVTAPSFEFINAARNQDKLA